jgi:hypothetical protein
VRLHACACDRAVDQSACHQCLAPSVFCGVRPWRAWPDPALGLHPLRRWGRTKRWRRWQTPCCARAPAWPRGPAAAASCSWAPPARARRSWPRRWRRCCSTTRR